MLAINKEELLRTIKSLQRLYDSLPDTQDIDEAPKKFNLLDAIERELEAGPLHDWELVEKIGPRVTWGKGQAEVWKSLLEHTQPDGALQVLDREGNPTEFNSHRTWKMSRRARTLKQAYPGNLIAIRDK